MVFWTAVDGHLAGGERLRVYLAASEGQICHVAMDADGHPCTQDEFISRIGGPRVSEPWPPGTGSGLIDAAAAQVEDYMAGRQLEFDLPLAYYGTPFQVSVWKELMRIPFGQTCSYGDIAATLGKPGAMRAVGQANGRNNLPLVIPCHRVVAASGRIGGFSGGVDLKIALLMHEQAVLEARGLRAAQMEQDQLSLTAS